MGHGSYTSADWAGLKTRAGITATSNERDIFKMRGMDPRFDPRLFGVREARDSEDHPNSTPVILGLDVTASMGYVASRIAKEGLNDTMLKLFSAKPVDDPQIMFAAIGDIRDAAPLQVTQFESDIRIAEQLLALWLENGGQGLLGTQYLWHFAATRVKADCFEKRDRKGFLFTIGDADCRPALESDVLRTALNDHSAPMSSADAAKKAGEHWEVFHIHITTHQKGTPKNIGNALPGRVLLIGKEEIGVIPDLIVTTMLMAGGKDRKTAVNQCGELSRDIVERATGTLAIAGRRRRFFF